MTKFKVGDKVRVLTNNHGAYNSYFKDIPCDTVVLEVTGTDLLVRSESEGLTQEVPSKSLELIKEPTMNQLPYTITNSSISVLCEGKMHNVTSNQSEYPQLVQLIRDGNFFEGSVSEVLNKTKVLFESVTGRVEVTENSVTFDGEEVHNSLAEKLLNIVSQGLDPKPWMNFMENLEANPSYRSREELFGFLEKYGAPITEDGCFVAFKRVRPDFTDIHTGTFDNSPGQVVQMERRSVDDNSSRTCSAGLHACASVYLESFGSWDRHKVVSVKINPKDVVSIPIDYQFSKMRVCKYTVLEELEQEGVEEIEKREYYEYASVSEIFDELEDFMNEFWEELK